MQFHEIPRPASRIAGTNHNDGSGPNSLSRQADNYRPRGVTAAEGKAATLARFAVRLVDRITGNALSLDEILSAILAARPKIGTPVHGVKATLTVNPAGDDNSVLYTAADAGVAGNSITVRYVIGGVAPVVTVAGTAITVTAPNTATAAQVITAVNASAAASALVVATASGTVTGTIAAVAAANLTGGVDCTAATAGDVLTDGNNIYVATTTMTKTSLSGWRKVAHSAL